MSLSELANDIAIVATKGTGKPVPSNFLDSTPWTVTLNYQGRTMTVPFFMGKANVKHAQACSAQGPNGWRRIKCDSPYCRPVPPTSEDVLSCLLSDASFTLNCADEFDLADELGEQVTRESRETWRQITSNTIALRSLLGVEFDKFMEAGEED